MRDELLSLKELTMNKDERNITSEVEAVLDEYVRPYLAGHSGNM